MDQKSRGRETEITKVSWVAIMVVYLTDKGRHATAREIRLAKPSIGDVSGSIAGCKKNGWIVPGVPVEPLGGRSTKTYLPTHAGRDYARRLAIERLSQ